MGEQLPATADNVAVFLGALRQMKTPEDFSRCLREWEFIPTEKFRGLDPASPAFCEAVARQYRTISGRGRYDPRENERNPCFDVRGSNHHVVYPFTTADPILAGSYLVGVGLALRAMQLPRGATIVEYGIGWGHTTIALAQLGYRVIAVDVEPNFLELVGRRAHDMGLEVTTHLGEFGDLPPDILAVDGVLFFECFHHCLHHQAVLGTLTKLLSAGGRIVLAGEPLFDAWHYPWGPRMDGQSVWAMATHGWMELGFERRYLEDLLRSQGLTLERHFHPEFGCVGEVYVGIKP